MCQAGAHRAWGASLNNLHGVLGKRATALPVWLRGSKDVYGLSSCVYGSQWDPEAERRLESHGRPAAARPLAVCCPQPPKAPPGARTLLAASLSCSWACLQTWGGLEMWPRVCVCVLHALSGSGHGEQVWKHHRVCVHQA